MKKIVIAGGGMLGLSLAFRLRQAGYEVHLHEAAGALGGLAAAWKLGDLIWDKHYHVTLLSDSHIRALLHELQLEEAMHWRKTGTGFFANGKLYPMSNALDYLRLPLLGPIAKARLAATILYGAREFETAKLDRETSVQWLERLSGREALARFWMPLLKAKLGSNADKVSAIFIQATIARLYAARRSGLKEELFGYLPGGYATLLARFGERLEEAGVKIHLESRLQAVEPLGKRGVLLRFANGEHAEADMAALTIPPPVVSAICPALSEEEHAQFRSVQYQGIVCASVLLKRPLSPYYVTNLADPDLPFTGVIDMTALVESGEFNGRGIVYLPRYASAGEAIWTESDESIRERFLAGLKRVYAALQEEEVLAFQVSRVPHVFALPLPGMAKRRLPMETSVAGLYCVNSAQIQDGTLNVNETVRLANEAAGRIRA